MSKKIDYVKEEINISEGNFEIIVTASGTNLLPNRNVTAFSEYVAYIRENETVFYYLKSKGIFKKIYTIEDEVILDYDTIEHAEIGTNGSMMYLQLVINNEVNAFVCKKTDAFKSFVKNINNKVEIVDIKTYNIFAK